jgi:hypothetical protein
MDALKTRLYRNKESISFLFACLVLSTCAYSPGYLADYGWEDLPGIPIGMGPMGSKVPEARAEAEMAFVRLAMKHGKPFVDAVVREIIRESDADKQFLHILKLNLLESPFAAFPYDPVLGVGKQNPEITQLHNFAESISPYVSQQLADLACSGNLEPDLVMWILENLTWRQREGLLKHQLVSRKKAIAAIASDSKYYKCPRISKVAEELVQAILYSTTRIENRK